MTWPAAVQAHLSARKPFRLVWLLYARPKPFGGGPRVGFGLSTGDDHEVLFVEGEARTYYGAQGGIEVPPTRYKVGTGIEGFDLRLGLTPEGETLVRGYDTRMAPAAVHCAVYDPETTLLLGLRRTFRGLIDAVTIGTPEQDGVASLEVSLVSAARRGTMTVVGVKSDASQRRRDPDDTFRMDSDAGRVASDPWGGKA